MTSPIRRIPQVSVVADWTGDTSPLVMDSVWSEGAPRVERDGVFLLNLGDLTAAFADRPLSKPPRASFAPAIRPMPGGQAVQFCSVYSDGPFGEPKTRTVDGPWAWSLSSRTLDRVPFPIRTGHVGPMIAPPNPLTMRDGRLRFGVISEEFQPPNPRAEYTMGFADAVTGDVTASVLAHDTYRVEVGSIVAMSSAPHGEYAATTKYMRSRGLDQAILIVNPGDGSIAQEIPNARLVGHNGWSPSGRFVMVLEDRTDIWAVHDLHTQRRRHIQLNRANAADYGDPDQLPYLIGWIDEDTVLISTRRGKLHLHIQTLDLATGHRQPVLTIKDRRVAHAAIHGVPDTMHLWEPLLP